MSSQIYNLVAAVKKETGVNLYNFNCNGKSELEFILDEARLKAVLKVFHGGDVEESDIDALFDSLLNKVVAAVGLKNCSEFIQELYSNPVSGKATLSVAKERLKPIVEKQKKERTENGKNSKKEIRQEHRNQKNSEAAKAKASNAKNSRGSKKAQGSQQNGNKQA
jgi:hypothetical protein